MQKCVRANLTITPILLSTENRINGATIKINIQKQLILFVLLPFNSSKRKKIRKQISAGSNLRAICWPPLVYNI